MIQTFSLEYPWNGMKFSELILTGRMKFEIGFNWECCKAMNILGRKNNRKGRIIFD
jgi:hypothetical protein